MSMAQKSYRGRLVLVVWLMVALLYFYLSYDYIRITMKDDEFSEYLNYVVGVAGPQHRPVKEVRQLILVKADELGLPVRGDHITVRASGETLMISVVYDVDIRLPIVARGIYQKLFQHKVEYKRPY